MHALTSPNLARFPWLTHGFGLRDTVYPARIHTVRQIHSATVLEARADGLEGDALISDQPGLVLGVRTADCVPVLLVDARTRAVAAVHAGWRGTAQNIVGSAVRELITRYGSRAEDLHVAVGPSIGRCCYEVSPETARQFDTWVSETDRLDLPGINEMQLRNLGVQDIWKAGECTFCQATRYFSFRREKEAAGRMISFIGQL